MDAASVLEALGGVARTGTLLRAGVDRPGLAHPRLRRLRRGVYALEDCRRDYREAIMANGVLTCVSGAFHHGLWLRDPPPELHVACDHGRAAGSMTVHRDLCFRPDPWHPVAALEDVVVHALVCQPAEVSIPLVTSALRKGLDLRLIEAQLTADRRRPALRTLRRADPRVESLPEAEALMLLVDLAERLGVEVVPQAYIPGIGRVDFLIAGWLIVEIDGVAFHSDRQSVRRDRARDNTATLEGYARLRYVPEVLWRAPEQFVGEIEAMLTGRIPRR